MKSCNERAASDAMVQTSANCMNKNVQVRRLGTVKVPETILASAKDKEKNLCEIRAPAVKVTSSFLKEFLTSERNEKSENRTRIIFRDFQKKLFEGYKLGIMDVMKACDYEFEKQMNRRCNKAILPPLPAKRCAPEDDCVTCAVELLQYNLIHGPAAMNSYQFRPVSHFNHTTRNASSRFSQNNPSLKFHSAYSREIMANMALPQILREAIEHRRRSLESNGVHKSKAHVNGGAKQRTGKKNRSPRHSRQGLTSDQETDYESTNMDELNSVISGRSITINIRNRNEMTN